MPISSRNNVLYLRKSIQQRNVSHTLAKAKRCPEVWVRGCPSKCSFWILLRAHRHRPVAFVFMFVSPSRDGCRAARALFPIQHCSVRSDARSPVRSVLAPSSGCPLLLVASLFLEVWPGAPSSFLLLWSEHPGVRTLWSKHFGERQFHFLSVSGYEARNHTG